MSVASTLRLLDVHFTDTGTDFTSVSPDQVAPVSPVGLHRYDVEVMRAVEIIQRPTDHQRTIIVDFVERIAAATGAQPLSDHLWLDLRSGGAGGFVAVTVADETGLIALAQISAANDTSSLEVVISPNVDDRDVVRDDAAATALDTFAAHGGGRVFWWVDDPSDADHAFADEHGFEPVRRLHEMRRELPLDQRASVPTRAFLPGVDDTEWISVNNRAFADHGEQGGWTADTLARRTAESWFDPEGFRLHEIDGRIAAFCWTKLHHDLDPVIGEIYVIAVDPDFHGRGLGRELTLAGLDSIVNRGVVHANLYVDADNAAAVSLYDSLGFHVHRSRQAFAADL